MAMKPYGPTYRLEPAGLFDRTDARVMGYEGQLVRKVQPYGCPRNGTMRMAYVMTVETGEFVGLVNLASLAKPEREKTT